MKKKTKVNVFINNKLISCDSILPLTLHLKKKYPTVTVTYYALNLKTYLLIKKNVNLYNLLIFHANLQLMGWKNFNKYLVKILKIIHIFYIIFNSIINKVANIHFKALSPFPYNLIYLFNKKNTYLFQSSTWGVNKNIAFSDIVFKNRDLRDMPAIKSFNTLVAFDKSWHQIKKSKIKNLYIINSTRFLESWQSFIKNEANNELKRQPKWFRKNRKYIIFVLGALDNTIATNDKSISGEMLLNKTLEIIIKETNYHILMKPHPITNMKTLKKILHKKNNRRLHIVDNHLAILSQISNIVIGNYFSLSMPDAWVNGAKVIEFTKYNPKILKFCNHKSVCPDYVDVFINDDINKLKIELKKKALRINRNINISDNNSVNKLIKKISFDT
tara:strand:- start:974 stop:2134 length:1161 start_codon:yes stop_codon:yes gene_type:complete